MSDDYTPDTDEVREAYVGWRAHLRRRLMGTSPVSVDAYYRDFDRWLNRVLADAWDEALGEVSASYTIPMPDNPYRKDNIND